MFGFTYLCALQHFYFFRFLSRERKLIFPDNDVLVRKQGQLSGKFLSDSFFKHTKFEA